MANRATERFAGLAPVPAALLRECETRLAAGDVHAAENAWLRASLVAPVHPETLRWSAELKLAQGLLVEALADAVAATLARPDDPALHLLHARIADRVGDPAVAADAVARAAALARTAAEHVAAGIAFDALGDAERALAAADRALLLDQGQGQARLLRVRALQLLGDGRGAALECRTLLRRKQFVAEAWWALLDAKTEQVSADELASLAGAEAKATAPVARTRLAFALGMACEQHGRVDEAFAAFARGNASMRASRPWDVQGHRARSEAVRDAFAGASCESDVAQGAGIVFLVGLPRSGTTLVEQVLAAHPRMEVGSELPFLPMVLNEESQRRGVPWPAWVARATPSDWAGMGRRYLELSARFRTRGVGMTDKLPANWLHAGAALAMMPGARIVVCRRDPLETAWSCFKQLFDHKLADFSYDFASIAAYWADAERLGDYWVARDPGRARILEHERLLADPEGGIRALLDFCGLPFSESCLRFHEAQRPVRSASALQVREPLRRNTARTSAYGALLDPLRAALAAEAAALKRQVS